MRLHDSAKLLQKYSRDWSVYSKRPKYVVFPRTEKDVQNIVMSAREKGLSVTGRGGGTGLSGASIGKGIVVDFTKHMNRVFKLGHMTEVQAGCLLSKLRPNLKDAGYMLPSVPLHNMCAIGGNVNTRSIGPWSLKYGSMHNQVKSVRGVLADGRVIDTGKRLPEELRNNILKLRREFSKERKLITYLKKRPFAAGGYHLLSFVENRVAEDIATHLIVGSVGTLVLLTEVSLELPRYREMKSVYLVHFGNWTDLQNGFNKAVKEGAVSVQYAGADALAVWTKGYRARHAVGALVIGFEKHTDFDCRSMQLREIPRHERAKFWKTRAQTLPLLEQAAKNKGVHLPPGIDDTTINPRDFGSIMTEIDHYQETHKIKIASFGHLGVGSIHLRPFINMKTRPEKLDTLGRDIFAIVLKYGGTLVGEHNSGLGRSRYLAMENEAMYAYMKKVKDLFDPDNLLNPGVMFDLEPATANIKV